MLPPSRRSFLKSASIAGAAVALPALQYSRVYGANSRLRIASVGTGGKGWSDLNGVAASPEVDVVGLCNIDSSKAHLGQAAEKYSAARTYADWRKLLDESKDIDGVMVSTPDFMHAPISLAAMQLGKHVFCQKPLTHTVFEARQMQLAAKKYKSVTQMCNQIQSHSAYRTAVNIVHTGLIGKVKEVHSWQSGSPSWPRHIPRPAGSDPVPASVDWDLWQGVAAERPYKAGMYHAFQWRGWQDYGTGQLGDFGCHILDPVFKSLKLGSPKKLTAQAPGLFPETWTDWATVHYTFPGTEYTVGDDLSVTWYDGVGVRPPREKLAGIPEGYKLPGAGSVLIGEKGTLVIPHVAMPKVFPEASFPADKVPVVEGVDHYTQWADACRGVGETTSHFDYAGPLTETVLLGTIGIRFPEQELEWNGEKMEITNFPQGQAYITKPYRKGWEPTWIA
ncbi:Inositol 2-dehydrogenase [Roseimaritima multifibrata]|uniref:Inositol 2-dehydrogenase n=1 Tax=Roseimaritima multifibrata TaxID=1930274 RepID=A0A517MAG1_9BACT|nr:Gfo/Idh/MocA family oxidoreductase [Roseimaritima multifibrata]QDS91866.1 Inositol 2-dehydrogenase [Roseimaritima multifibrata]